ALTSPLVPYTTLFRSQTHLALRRGKTIQRGRVHVGRAALGGPWQWTRYLATISCGVYRDGGTLVLPRHHLRLRIRQLGAFASVRSEEHTSELQSLRHL